jgi:hypothetical protein
MRDGDFIIIDLNTDNSGAVVGRDCMVVGYTISGVMVDLCALLCDRLSGQIVVWSKERLQNLYYQRWSLCNGL